MSAIPHPLSFTLYRTLLGHTGPINISTISPDHAWLMSGGDDCTVIIWNLMSGLQFQSIDTTFHGPALSGAWIYEPCDLSPKGMIIGCADGTLQHFKKDSESMQFVCVTVEQASPRRQGVDAVAFNATHALVASAGGGLARVWEIDTNGLLRQVASFGDEDFITTSVLFLERQLVLCYLESCEAVAYDIDSEAEIWRRTLRTRIGFAASANGLFVVSNLYDGVDIYNLPPTRLLGTHEHATDKNLALQVAEVFQGRFYVVGSSTGLPRVFDLHGELKQTIPHGDGPVQTVSSSHFGDVCYLTTAGAVAPFDVKVWQAVHRQDLTQSAEHVLSSDERVSFRQLLLVLSFCMLLQVGVPFIPASLVSHLRQFFPQL